MKTTSQMCQPRRPEATKGASILLCHDITSCRGDQSSSGLAPLADPLWKASQQKVVNGIELSDLFGYQMQLWVKLVTFWAWQATKTHRELQKSNSFAVGKTCLHLMNTACLSIIDFMVYRWDANWIVIVCALETATHAEHLFCQQLCNNVVKDSILPISVPTY